VERAVFTLQLATPSHLRIGQISCYRQVDEVWLADTDLLAGDFRRSLALALENCVMDLQPPRVEEREDQNASYRHLALEHAMRHPALLEAVSNLRAADSSGGD
jgi:hypothetical protein